MTRARVIVEGHGEVEAVGNLLTRVCLDLELPLHWSTPMRWKNLLRQPGVVQAANHLRNRGDCDALLILRDEDDGCPRKLGPEVAQWLRELELPFPAAVVLLHPEYEVLFLPCVEGMAGRMLGRGTSLREGLRAGTRWTGASWQAHRGVKEWLSQNYAGGHRYKPTTDQLELTRMIDLPTLRAANVPCYGTLERALVFLAEKAGRSGGVYPPG